LRSLRCLINHHGLNRVFSEGFSPTELEAYREKIAVLRAMDKEEVPQVRKLVNGATGDRRMCQASSVLTPLS
jgi:hypothetical protein